MPDLVNLSINKLMVHRLFKRADDGSLVTPQYGASILTLSNEESDVMRERISAALGATSKSIDMDIIHNGADSTVGLMTSLSSLEDTIFIVRSQQIALRLAEAQTTRRISDCVVFIFTGTTGTDGRKFAALIKSESQSAFQLAQDAERGNIIALIRDALLGKDHKPV